MGRHAILKEDPTGSMEIEDSAFDQDFQGTSALGHLRGSADVAMLMDASGYFLCLQHRISVLPMSSRDLVRQYGEILWRGDDEPANSLSYSQ